MAIRAGSLLVRRLVIDNPKGGQDLLSLADLTGELVSVAEEGIADRQFLSIFGCIHQHGACRHQSERPKVVGFGPSTYDCPMNIPTAAPNRSSALPKAHEQTPSR